MACFLSGFKMFDTNGICSKESAAFWGCYQRERGTVGLRAPSSLAALVGFDKAIDPKHDKDK
jgi:hypothetical protein